MTDDPWKSLTPPTSADALTARRVDAAMPWGFFWARGVDGRCRLLLRHALESSPRTRLPHLKGIETTLSDGESDGSRILVWSLLDSAQRDIFHRLCLDIMTSSTGASDEAQAIRLTLARTWRWHHLLRGGGTGLLSPEEQKGLIGELLVLDLLLGSFSANDAVCAWRGPLGAPKDFGIGRLCIEAKARRGSATPYVAISSEHQLDTSGVDALFLHVVELDEALSDAVDGFTLPDIALRIHASISAADHAAGDTFESLLFAAGFRWEDDYSEMKWVRGSNRIYRVDDGFPCVTPASFASGVLNVRYSVSLFECEPFRVSEETMSYALAGNAHEA